MSDHSTHQALRSLLLLTTVAVAVAVAVALALALIPWAAASGSVSPTADAPGGFDLDRSPGEGPDDPTEVKNLTTGIFYSSLAAALLDPLTLAGHTLEVQTSYPEGIVNVNKAVTIQGKLGTEVITPTTDTGSSGDARGWILVSVANVTIKNLSFNGTGKLIYQAVRCLEDGAVIENCTFSNIRYATYLGMAVVGFKNTTVNRCSFLNIERIGVILFGADVTSGLVTQCTYIGKGVVDGLDYGIELGGGAVATLTKNAITNCKGVASSDGSTSAAVLITTYFGLGTAGTLSNNFLFDNTGGIAAGYDPADASAVTASNNSLTGNTYGIGNVSSTTTVNGSANWWGSNSAVTVASLASGTVDYTPWLDVGDDISLEYGFQGSFSTLHVDDDSPQVGSVGRIQEGVNLVTASTVVLGPGTYEEQVIITTDDLTLDGAGIGSTIIKSPTTLPAFFVTGIYNNYPVVFVNGADNVTIQELTVDGFGRGNSNYRFQGIGYWNADGLVSDVEIKRIEDTPFSGAQHGVALFANNSGGGPYSLEVGNVTITDFQKNATALGGNGLTIDVHDVSIAGKGPTATTAQNGIQVGGGASGTVSDVTVSDIEYTPATYTACGLLIYGGGPVYVSGSNTITDCQTAVYYEETDGSISGCSISGGTWSALFYNLQSSFVKSTPEAGDRADRPRAAPFEVAEARSSGDPRDMTLFSVAMSSGCILGTDTAGSSGVYVYSAGGGLNVSLTNLRIQDWDVGVAADGPVAITAHDNAIASNLSAGFDNTLSLAAQDAERNWWGSSDGPAPPGSGEAILGTGVDVTPWRASGGSSTACAFTPANVVTPAPPGGCISNLNPCMTVPFTIARTDAVLMRGYTVTFQLGGGLSLCGPGITQGTYLSSVPGIMGTTFFTVDNGGGSYTADCAINGLPCGATASGGTLFSAAVTGASPSATETITITSIIARDCSNAPIPVSDGPPAAITIDTTGPTAVTNLGAAQLVTGNDTNGTTKITLTWAPPGGAAVTEVYRAPFGVQPSGGSAYPEYDDIPLAGAPTAPSYGLTGPGAPWVLTGVTTSGQMDEPVDRGFWYYVVFTKDACGSVSAVSNMTGGALNYHLGDVTNGSPGNGNNEVDTNDISLLGNHYGETPSSGGWTNYLDVGPTTDYSTLAMPTTDNRVNFEDLMMFAINFGTVSLTMPPGLADIPAGRPGLVLRTEPTADGVLARLFLMDNPGNVKGIHALIDFDNAGLGLLAVEQGSLLAAQGQPVFFRHLDEGAAGVHAALLGEGIAIHGTGEIATLRFGGHGSPSLTLADLRDLQNQPAGEATTEVETPIETAGTPVEFALLAARPNPFNPSTMIGFQLPIAGRVDLRIYDIGGRLVRMLVEAELTAGAHTAFWDGRDARGMLAGSGVYLVRLDSVGRQATQKIQLMK